MTTTAHARDKDRVRPVYLAEIALLNGGPTLYFSDRNIEVGGQYYEDYLFNLSGLGEELRRADSEGVNTSISLRFKNERYQSYYYLIEIGDTYPFDGAECVIKEAYLDDAGAPSDTETLFKGVLDEPRNIDLMGYWCTLSSVEFHKSRQWSHEVINKTDFPGAWEDVGKVIPFVYGSGVLMPAHRVKWGVKTTLVSSITAAATNCEVSDASRLPVSGYVWMDDEQAAFTKAGNTLNLTRAQGGTTATPHQGGAVIWQHLTEYDSVLAGHELHTVGDIFAEIDDHLIRVTSGVSAVFSGGRHLLRATSQIRIKPTEDQIGVTDNITVSDNISVSDNIAMSLGGLNKSIYPDSSTGGSNPNNSIDGNTDTYNQVSPGQINTVGFPSTSYGTIATQYVYATVLGNFDIIGGWTPNTISAGAKGRFRFQKSGGNWGDSIGFKRPSGASGAKLVYEVDEKVVEYTGSANKTGSAYKAGGSAYKSGGEAYKIGETVISTRVVDRFHAVVSGYKDLDGNYGGTGSLIERPDHVMKHFLVQKMGFALADIDDVAFDAAGSSYDAAIPGGYRFAFAVDRKIEPAEFVRRLAFECRSTIKFHAGIWHLNFIPDTAPAAVKTITKEELAGRHSHFRFDRTPVVDLKNDLTARFEQNYSHLGSESSWNGTSKKSDSASKTKYETYPGEFEFECIRSQAIADDVLAHMLLQTKAPLLRVRFRVFYEHFDLKVGDTIEIDNPLYDGTKFFIESIRRDDKFRAEIGAVEWWG